MTKPALDLASLTDAEKLELIDELWESLGPDGFPLTEELRSVLDRRIEAMERDGSAGVSWESVRAEMTPRTP